MIKSSRPSRWILARTSGLTTAMLLLACGGGTPRSASLTAGSVAVPDRGRATRTPNNGEFDDRARCEYRGHDDRETSETAGPGAVLPNVRRVYQILGNGEDRRKVLICREIDTNLDGVKDVVRTFNDKGESLHEEADADYDGRMDTWITFNNGRLQKEAIDKNKDGHPDEWRYYIRGALYRIQRDTNKDHKPDVWEFYQQGHLERMGVDLDHDGHVDRWDHDEVVRRTADAADRAAERSAGAPKSGEGPAPSATGELSSPPSPSSAGSAAPPATSAPPTSRTRSKK